MTDAANAIDGENASAPAAAKAAPKDPWALPDVSHLVVGVLGGTGTARIVDNDDPRERWRMIGQGIWPAACACPHPRRRARIR